MTRRPTVFAGFTPLLAAAVLGACAKGNSEPSRTWLGDACGVPHLDFSVDERRKILILGEHHVQGSVMTDSGLAPVPVSSRQKLIESALPCLGREARRRGLTLDYPVMNVDG
jgi:hypothetical protein